MNKLLSVIIPIYNAENYIEDCIESVLMQTYQKMEIVLVDDGSKDKSGLICDRYGESDERVIVIHQENKGPMYARRAGLLVAKGEYIGFVDSDDTIEANMYERLIDVLEEESADVIHSGYVSKTQNSIDFSREVIDKENAIDLLERVLLHGDITPSIWSKVYKREYINRAFEEVFDETIFGEDMVCLVALLFTNPKIVLLNEAFYNYRVRSNSLSHYCDTMAIKKELQLYNNIQFVLEQHSAKRDYEKIMNVFLARHVIYGLSRTVENEFWINIYEVEDVERYRNKRIVLYGAGEVGKSVYSQLSRYGDICIVCWVDRNNDLYRYACRTVESPSILQQINFDLVLVAVKSSYLYESIRSELEKEHSIDDKMIEWSQPHMIV